MTDCTCNNFPSGLGTVTFGDKVTIGLFAHVDPGLNAAVFGGLGLDGILRVTGNTSGGRVDLNLNNDSPSGGKSCAIRLKAGGGTRWEIGNDLGVNGGQDLFLYDGVAGQVRLFVDSDGRLGIGTTAPTARLHVVGSNTAHVGLTVRGADGQTADLFQWVRHDGFVFGGFNPSGLIELQGAVGAIPSYHGIGRVGNYVSLFSATSGGYGAGVDGGTGFRVGSGSFANPHLAVEASSGKVGIGTATPQNRLDVEGAVAIGAGYSGSEVGPTNGLIVEGNVGIGTAAPSEKVDVIGNVKGLNLVVAAGGLLYGAGDPATGLSFPAAGVVAINTGAVERIRVDENGNVGIGVTSPGAKLDVAGAVRVGGREAINSAGQALYA